MDENRQNLLDQAQKLVADSALEESDKKLLLDLIPRAPTPIVNLIVTTCKEDPSMLDMMVKNLKLKLDARNNPEKFREIIRQEREGITQASTNHPDNSQLK